MGMRRVLVAAVTVVVSVSLVGCSEKDVKSEPSPTASVSESVAPKEESAEEFIRRWFQAQEDMQNSGDTTAYSGMSTACTECAKVADRIAGIYAAGGTVDYRGHDVVFVKPRTGVPSTYDVRLKVRSTEYNERAGSPREWLHGGTDNYAVTVAKKDDAWQVTHLLATSS